MWCDIQLSRRPDAILLSLPSLLLGRCHLLGFSLLLIQVLLPVVLHDMIQVHSVASRNIVYGSCVN